MFCKYQKVLNRVNWRPIKKLILQKLKIATSTRAQKFAKISHVKFPISA